MSPIRIFPDAPRGLALLSRPGLVSLAIEFASLPAVVIIALWPRSWAGCPRAHRRADPEAAQPDLHRGRRQRGRVSAPPGPAPVATDGGDPSLRSTGIRLPSFLDAAAPLFG
jgi:hypothetical protein